MPDAARRSLGNAGTRVALALLAGVLVLVAPPDRAARADTGPLIRHGDRVVFVGDEVTDQRLYTRFVQQFFYCRYPEADVRWFNAALPGDTAGGALGRFDRDVAPLKPTVVFVMLGTNDGGYAAKDDGVVATYRKGIADLVARAKAVGARAIVATTPCADGDRMPAKGFDYNATLDALARAAVAAATEGGAEAIDVFHPMLEYQAARKGEDAGWSMAPGGTHPNADGHVVMTRFLLEGLGVDGLPEFGSADVASGKGEGVKVDSVTKEEVVLSTTGPSATPFWFEPGSMPAMTSTGFLERFAGRRLTVTGLPKGDWTVSMDGQDAGTHDAADFAHGLKVPGTASVRGKDVHDLVWRKENGFRHAWNDVKVGLAGKTGVDSVVAGLLAADDGWHSMVREQAKPHGPHVFTLVPAPDGPNLARGKTFWSSDNNRDGWHAGLTDGSWSTEKGRCFATGDDPAFPKTVTIDLGAPVKISIVRMGVPDFGSTRSVEIAVGPDWQRFKSVGTREFPLKKKDRWTEKFHPTVARYVRLTFKKNHSDPVGGHSTNLCFATEVEVFGAK
jgi:lysophospholipase L1-like esterase